MEVSSLMVLTPDPELWMNTNDARASRERLLKANIVGGCGGAPRNVFAR